MFLLVSLDLGLSLGLSLLATAAFSSIFFVWFAGTIHSVYASQMLFPVLAAWLFIRYVQRKLLWLLLAASISSAFGAGMRPSDGFFLFPLLAFVTFRYVKNWAHRSLAAATYGLVCLGWYLPTLMASHQANQTLSGQLAPLTHTTSLVFGAPLTHVAANMLRVLLPGLAAFWMLLPAWFLPRSRQELFVILLWVLPGCLFLLVVYMADAPYLTFMVAPLILLAALSRKRRLAFTSLAACALWNCLFFLCARPLANRSLMASSINYYTVKYTRYGLVHHWSSTVHDKSNSIP
ncbi:MAG: hypothetical protein JOZ33_16360 [Acidobacteriaceae bacterium]|nr:hypothetical protein [Acidobacteriaceae bacterium]